MQQYPADPVACTLMAEQGIDITQHRAQQATPALLLQSDIIFTMSTAQNHEAEKIHPCIRGRVHRLGEWSGFDIPDPYQRPRAAFEQSLLLITQGIHEWMHALWKTPL